MRHRTRVFWLKIRLFIEGAKKFNVADDQFVRFLNHLATEGIPSGGTFFGVEARELPPTSEFEEQWRAVANFLEYHSEVPPAWVVGQIRSIMECATATGNRYVKIAVLPSGKEVDASCALLPIF